MKSRYQNASEVMREGLRMIEQREELEAAKLKALGEVASLGFADLDGRFDDLPADRLEDDIGSLGREAVARVRKASPRLRPKEPVNAATCSPAAD